MKFLKKSETKNIKGMCEFSCMNTWLYQSFLQKKTMGKSLTSTSESQ